VVFSPYATFVPQEGTDSASLSMSFATAPTVRVFAMTGHPAFVGRAERRGSDARRIA
jgi:hypothetical protein